MIWCSSVVTMIGIPPLIWDGTWRRAWAQGFHGCPSNKGCDLAIGSPSPADFRWEGNQLHMFQTKTMIEPAKNVDLNI